MNFINNDPDHIEVLESKLTSATTNANSTTTEVYSFNGKLIIFQAINSISDNDLMALSYLMVNLSIKFLSTPVFNALWNTKKRLILFFVSSNS